MLPAENGGEGNEAVRKNVLNQRKVVVVLPFEPVMPMSLPCRNRVREFDLAPGSSRLSRRAALQKRRVPQAPRGWEMMRSCCKNVLLLMAAQIQVHICRCAAWRRLLRRSRLDFREIGSG